MRERDGFRPFLTPDASLFTWREARKTTKTREARALYFGREQRGRRSALGVSMETRHLVTLLQAEAPVSLAGVQRFVEALLEEHVTPSTVGEIVLRVHGFLCHAETHLQHAAPQTVTALAATSDDHKCVRDALEKLLVSKVYHRVFGVSEGGMERDAALYKRLSGLSHLTCVGAAPTCHVLLLPSHYVSR